MEKEAINKAVREITGLDLDFYSSLDACAEFEATLKGDQRANYAAAIEGVVENELWEACGKPTSRRDWQLCKNTGDPHGSADYEHSANLVSATARQRRLAYLLTVAPGKLKEI